MISGKLITGFVGSNPIAGLYQYSWREKVDELDGTTGFSAGFEVVEPGVKGGTLTMRCYFDLLAGGFAPFQAGAYATNIALRDHPDAPPFLSIPLGLVTEAEKTGEVKGRLEYNITIRTVGAFSYTGG